MKFPKFLKIMSFFTVLGLTYIHMQMQIIDLAYQGNRKEQTIKKLIEENGSTTYKILILKSANHLGVAMLDKNSGMQFADKNDIVQIAASDRSPAQDVSDQPELAKRSNPLLNLLSFGAEAEAKTAK